MIIGNLVGAEHFNNSFIEYKKNTDMKPFDRNKESKAYIPKDGINRIYYYGAFFGGKVHNVIEFCKILILWQKYDKTILNYEPIWNDESYINKYFNTNPHAVVLSKDFVPNISDKGGFEESHGCIRNINNDWGKETYMFLQENIEIPFTFIDGKIHESLKINEKH